MNPELTKAGRYQIVEELGRGAMGIVYRAFDPVIGRTVAIKTMLTEGLTPEEYEEFRDRFQREAQAAGILNHPNIVTVYDFGEDQGFLYLAMEFLEGKSLQEVLRERKALAPDEAAPLFEQAASALDHAHAHNVIHRDVKPANIMLLKQDLVKVTDFGIAKVSTTSMTQTGRVFGTPNYMSPEQVRGLPVDGRSDLFALGVILYEAVTGAKPFSGNDITTVLYKIVHEDPVPPLQLRPGLHPGLAAVIQKALAKDPGERYITCRAFAQALRNYQQLAPQSAPAAAEETFGATVLFGTPAAQRIIGEIDKAALTSPTIAPTAPGAGPIPPGRTRTVATAESPISAPAIAKPTGRAVLKRPAIAVAIICGIIVLAAVGYYLLVGRKAPQKSLALTATPVATAAERQIEQQAERFQSQGRLDDAVAEWRALAALNGPSRDKAEQQISSIEALKQQEQDLFHKGQAAQSARRWKDALAFYQQAADLKGDMQSQALAAIETVHRIEQGENVSAIEERAFKSATAALREKQYEQARNLFEQVVTLNVSGSKLLPQARTQVRQIDSILSAQQAAQRQAREKEQQTFQAAATLLKQGKLPEAKSAFQSVVAMNGDLKGEAQSGIQQIDNLLAAQQNSLGQREQQLFNAALASEKNGQFSDAKSKFEAVMALNGTLKGAAQAQIQQIDQQLQQQMEFQQLVTQFNQAKQQNDVQSLRNLLPLFKDLATASGPVAGQAQEYAQTLIPQEINRIQQAKPSKAQPVVATAAKKISVTLLEPPAPLRWTRKVQPGHLYSQAYIDGGLKLLRHEGLEAIAAQAKSGGVATVTLQINEKGQVTGGQVLEDTSGAGQSVLAAALQGWMFSPPAVKGVAVTTTATVKVQF